MDDEDDDVYATRFKASGWLSSAYHLLDRDPEMLSAANMYYEGISVLPDHPSLAFVCFVSVVETLSVRKHGYPDRCRFCNSYCGLGRRFRNTLKPVLDPDDVETVANAYDRRSRTLHEGKLHGRETYVGLIGETGLLSERATFSLTAIRFGEAVRALLKQELKSSAP